MVDKSKLIPFFVLTGMVSSDKGLPDPDNPNGELKVSNEDVILVTDDDDESDQETVTLDEYQPLPVDEEAADSNHGYDSSEDEASGHQFPSSNAPVPPITPMEQELVREVWSVPAPNAVDIEMDTKKVDELSK
ncbi:hypothetical protein NQ318_009322 [Aromia moschata]|uniref:Uncharacterized protein n=1 Tax=Aromia moschata TaxID=1265417 RepID=A0AAV8XDS8_9CUCU|nr:hypothetical protein NQ318_009322 [Aromia moschata]